MKVFIIPGYGIPESIEQDQNYQTYLNIAFNRIFDSAKDEKALIIPCGGATNCTPPYEGTEAVMIGDCIQKLIDRPMMNDRCKNWSIALEDRSLSTLENLVFAKVIIDAIEESVGSMTIFCEATRENRMRTVASMIFDSSIPVVVEPVDFDISANRYLEDAVINAREKQALDGSIAALESPERFAKEHELLERRLTLIRSLQNDGMSHVDAVAEWYRQAPEIIAEVMSSSSAVVIPA